MDKHSSLLKTIYNQLDNFGSAVIHKSRLCTILNSISSNKLEINKMISILKTKNKIKLIFSNYFYILNSDEQIKNYYKYSTEEIVFLILNKLKLKWYLALHSSLLINNINYNLDMHQIPKTTVIINSRYSKTLKILNQTFIFKKQLNFRLIGLLESKTKNSIKFYFSDLERTYLDYLYYNNKSIVDLDIINKDKLKLYLTYFPKMLFNKVYLDEQ